MADNLHWATPEDFTTLFCYLWHQNFPFTLKATGARAIDWNLHTSITIRGIADLFGYFTRFEKSGRLDAVIRSNEGSVMAIEWEWKDTQGRATELKKLMAWAEKSTVNKSYCIFITYSLLSDIEKTYQFVLEKWNGAPRPLLLLLVDYTDIKRIDTGNYVSSNRLFNNITTSIFDGQTRQEIRSVPALPWELINTRWYASTDSKYQ